uniref:Pyruvate kinase n=1 Tax=Diplonema papillatum TaxID=91374 RepID=A0A0B6VT91_9EUGL|nr:pyruvate kinase [Diplonema papillatum]
MDLVQRQFTQLDHNILHLSVHKDTARQKHAVNIVCTIGPPSQSVEELKGLIKAGMTVARLNCSHGNHAFHRKTIQNVRKAAAEMNVIIAIAVDTKGPEIRTGRFAVEGDVLMPIGHEIVLTVDPAFENACTKDIIYVDYPNIVDVIKVGQNVYIDDGLLALKVTAIDGNQLKTVVTNPHKISSRRGVNLANVVVDLPPVSEQDVADLQFAVDNKVDLVFASFVTTPEQVRSVRKCLGDSDIRIFSKISNAEGVEKFDEILAETDGVMVARGHLGCEIPLEKVFVAQKMMVSKCNAVGKPVIVATQMLESMMANPRPTRAEVSDVANAVLDGADAVMLSGETAAGDYRKESVEIMRKITVEGQLASREECLFESIKAVRSLPIQPDESIACAAVNSAYELQAKAIIALTELGLTASIVAKYRPMCPIVAVTSNSAIARRLVVHRFVRPVITDIQRNEREARIQFGIDYCKAENICRKGDRVVLIHGGAPTTGPFENHATLTRIIVVP